MALLQEDPPLDVNEANEHGVTPVFAAFKELLVVEKAQAELAADELQRPSKAIRAAMELNAELSTDLQDTVNVFKVWLTPCRNVVCRDFVRERFNFFPFVSLPCLAPQYSLFSCCGEQIALLVHKSADVSLVEASEESSPHWSLLHYCASHDNARRAKQLLKWGRALQLIRLFSSWNVVCPLLPELCVSLYEFPFLPTHFSCFFPSVLLSLSFLILGRKWTATCQTPTVEPPWWKRAKLAALG